MHGRRLATTEKVIALTGRNGAHALERLGAWTDEHGLELETVAAGNSIEDIYEPEQATVGITLGGDGVFLEGVRTFAPRGIPQFGVNTDQLAFLARVAPEDLPAALTEIKRGRADVDSRQQLQVSSDDLATTGINDVIFQSAADSEAVDRTLVHLHVFADEEYVGRYEGNGLVIGTPTGSTGISLSANGPIQYPENNATLQVVPLNVHRLGVRPLIVSAETELTVVPEEPAGVLVDGGRSRTVVGERETVTVTGAEEDAHIIRTSKDSDFFTALSSRLGWGLRGSDATGPTAALGTEHHSEALLDQALSIAREAARAAGETLSELHGRVESVQVKTDKADIVTEADYQSQNIITTVIENEFPDHGIISEEGIDRETESDYTWVVDPLDGTGNFAHGNPNYAVSIGLLDAGEPVLGIVHAPETDELFHAVAGGPAYEGETRLTTTDRDDLAESMLLSGYDPDGTFLSHFYQETRGVRRVGSAALNLCYLAAGTADAVWEYDTYPWDVAAGLVIARAAGAKITDASGEPYELELHSEDERTELLGSNGPLHPALLDHLEAEGGGELQ